MLLEQQPAFVLHSRAYRETSLLLECLTRDLGRIGVVARGVRGARSRTPRSHLEPFQALLLDLQLRGELATLRHVELASPASRLSGDAALAGLYLNELIVRLTERQDPHTVLYGAYARTLDRLATGTSLGWQLRRFERDLLATLGYAMQLEREADSDEPLQPDASYLYRPEHGAIRCGKTEPHAVNGSALLALGADHPPSPTDLQSLRGMMRELIRFHLGGVELRAWRVLRDALKRR